MAEESKQETFVSEWLAELLTALPERIPEEAVSMLFQGCATVHYRHAKRQTKINLPACARSCSPIWTCQPHYVTAQSDLLRGCFQPLPKHLWKLRSFNRSYAAIPVACIKFALCKSIALIR